jgi:hypothetical protein
MHQIIYSSAAVAPFSERELTELLTIARLNNARVGVTGMLLYHEGSFLQALEGDEPVLDALFAKISKDKRQHRVINLLRREIDKAEFDQWQMGFASTKGLPRHMPGFSDYLRLRGELAGNGDVAARLLAAFRDGRFRNYVQA